MNNLKTTELGIASTTAFQAATKSGITLDLTLIERTNGADFFAMHNGELRYATGSDNIKAIDGNLHIFFKNEYATELLIGKKVTGWLRLTKGTSEDVAAFKTALHERKESEGKTQLEKLLKSNATVSFIRRATGYGRMYTPRVEGEDLAPVCKRTLADYAEQLDKAKRLTFEANYDEYDARWMATITVMDLVIAGSKLQEEKDAKNAARKAEREAKFAEAKETGKPVLLGSYFVSGSDIPRKFRDDDSDMGHLNTWAQPDGTTKESFSHSY